MVTFNILDIQSDHLDCIDLISIDGHPKFSNLFFSV